MISVIIPAKNEFLLKKTIESILGASKGVIEVIAVLDGYWPEPAIIDDPRVTLIHHTKSVGQRHAVNEAAQIARGKYILKTDSHSTFDEGFDVKLAEDCEYDWCVLPRMYNLHAFDWVCDNGHRFYQDKADPHKENKCPECGEIMKIEYVWKRRQHKKTDFMYMDSNLKVQYWREYEQRKQAKGDIVDVMNGIGACWFQHKDRFLELGGLDEGHGSWGQVGVEVACKTWLSGGRHVVNKKTWFAHMFRTTGPFSFPYKIKGSDQEKARKYSRDLWLNDKWPLAKRKFNWLIEKFSPVPTWESEPKIATNNEPLVSVIIPSRNEPYLSKTIEDCLAKLKTNFEIIAGLDGYYDNTLTEDKRVIKCHSADRIGMRPMINKMAKMARGKYLLRLDGHCKIDEGFDEKLISVHKPGYTVAARWYELNTEKWKRRDNTLCDYRYLSNPKVDEKGGLRGLKWKDYDRPHQETGIDDLMVCQGSNWLIEREQFLKWGGYDEKHGTFGQEGVEISCMTWLSGGRLILNKDTWYAHWNRGKACYSLSRNERPKSVARSIELWMGDKWPHATRKFQWLIDKFAPVPGWPSKDDLTILYYTDNVLPESFARPVREHLKHVAVDYPIISISQEPMEFGENICVGNIGRSFRNILKQILTGAKAAKTSFVAMCEHDNIYPKEHFDLRPERDVVYNQNRTRFLCDAKLFRCNCGGKSMSLCIARKDILINDIEQKLDLIKDNESFRKRFEPGKNQDLLDIAKVRVDLGRSEKSILSICNHGRNYGGRNHVKDDLRQVEPDWGTYEQLNEKFHIEDLFNETTIIYITANKEPETIAKAARKEISKVSRPVISVSQKPIKFGENICVGNIGVSSENVLRQFLKGAEQAKTKYVSMAQADCLYPPEHFDFKPPRDDVAYWNSHIYRFNPLNPAYVRKQNPNLSTLCGDRRYLINTIGEILKTPPDSRGRMKGIREYGQETFETELPVITISHQSSMHWNQHKKNGDGVAELPFWGKADELAEKLIVNDYRYIYGYRCRWFDVNELYDNFVDYADPNKRAKDNPRGVYEFQKTFRPFVDDIIAGKKYTDNELKSLPYYSYLVKHLRKLPDYTNFRPDEKGIRHVIGKMRNAENLIKDIRNNGIKSPLCLWRNGEERILQRGQRRIVILKKLGHKKALGLLFDSKELYDKRIKRIVARSKGTIEKEAENQFAKMSIRSTDKYWKHNYIQYYDRHIKNPKKILEIGVWKGASLLLWSRAFPKAKIYGIEINDVSQKKLVRRNPDWTIFQGDATDKNIIKKVSRCGWFDLIVDDGSHNPVEIKASLEGLWPSLSKGGWYVIEDLWNQQKFSNARPVIMDKLKSMIDEICTEESVETISFYPNICFIQKGVN